MSIITIVGAGMMGSAMSIPAADNGHEVRIVGTPLDREIIAEAAKTGYHKTLKRKLPDGIRYFQAEDLDAALENCNLLIGGISSFGVEWFGTQVLPKVSPNTPILLVTKGLHTDANGKFVPFPDYLATFPNGNNLSINAVGGPCISFELADRHHTVVAFCGHSMETLEQIKKMLSTHYYHINLTCDVIGLEIAVALKNAYALGVSLAIGLAESKSGEGCPEEYNPQAGLFAQSVRETQKLLHLAHGSDNAILYHAGDLYVTVFGGRTRRIGTLLGRGLTYQEACEQLSGVTLESVAITKVVVDALALQGKDITHYPLLSHIYNMIVEGVTVDIPWDKFEA